MPIGCHHVFFMKFYGFIAVRYFRCLNKNRESF